MTRGPAGLAVALVFALGCANCRDHGNTASESSSKTPTAGETVSAATGPASPSAAGRSSEAPAPEFEDPDHATAECAGIDALDPYAAMDEAARRYDQREFMVALACTELAAELIPQAVEAHHLRAAALAGLQRFAAADTAFAQALALDPDDPETLAAAADFHINVRSPRHRRTTLLGLTYARRGSDKASSRRTRDRELRARLALLEGQALNDLARPDEALLRIDDSLSLVADSVAAHYERGFSLFNLCRFDDAYTEFATVLEIEPDDPYAHFHLGLIFERKQRGEIADEHFRRAQQIAPEDFPAPVEVPAADFQRRVDEAVAALPDDVRQLLTGVRVEVAELPDLADLSAHDPPFAPTILGLYRGAPLPTDAGEETVAGGPAGEALARTIVLYRRNLQRAVTTPDQLTLQIRKTLWHEIGHLRGLDEAELRRRGLE